MKRLLPALLTVMSVVSGPTTVLLADEVYSGIAGYSEKVLPSARDTYVSVPVRAGEAALGELTLEGSPDTDGNQGISISGLGGWSADELAERHAVRLFEGVGEGLRFPVSANNGSTATVNFETAAPSPGALVALEEEWTLDTLFPPATQAVFHESTSKFASGRRSELIVLSPQSNSGLVSGARIYFLESGAWFESGGSFRAAGTDRIPVDAVLVIRHPSGLGGTSWDMQGIGFHGPVASRIVRESQVARSYSYGLLKLGGTTLADLNLSAPAFRESSGVAVAERVDILQRFETTLPASPTPAATFFTTSTGWKNARAGTPVADAEVLPNGSALVIENLTAPAAHQSNWIQTGATAP